MLIRHFSNGTTASREHLAEASKKTLGEALCFYASAFGGKAAHGIELNSGKNL